MKKIYLLLWVVLLWTGRASALNVVVTESPSGVYSMPARWQSVLTAMGHTVNLQPISVLDNNSFFASTQVLIVSDGTASYSTTQINTIRAFLQSGKPVYLQTEYQSSYGGNTAFAQIVNALGSSFTWGSTLNDDQNPNIYGSFATTNNTVASLPYFWYGCTGTAGANMYAFVRSTPGNVPLGWSFCPSNSSYGKMITTTDQDWIQNTPNYPIGADLMENIFTHLITPGLCGITGPDGDITSQTNVSCNGGNNGAATVSVTGGTPPYTYSWAPSGGTGASISGRTAGTYICTITDASSQTDTVSVTITQPPVLSSAGSSVQPCGSNPNGSATVVVSGGTPPYTYSWSPSGGSAATASNLAAGNYTCNYTDSKGCPGSRPFTLTAQTVVVPAVTVTPSSSSVCAGSNVTFTATPTNGGSTPAYQWRKNGIDVGTNSTTYSDNALVNGDVITVRLTSNATCRNVDTISSAGVTMTVNPVLLPSVSIATNTGNTICTGTNVTFTATPTNGGSTPAYQWRKNGIDVGTNSATYNDNALANGDMITVKLTSDAICRSMDTVNSTGIPMTVNPMLVPAVSITAGTGSTICTGTNVTFTATPTNGGSTPVYQWRKNGIDVGTNSATYTDNALINGDVVTVKLTSNAACRTLDTVNSSGITMTVNPALVPAVTVASSASAVCAGTNVTFTATPTNGGSTPVYQWRKNGIDVGTNSATYTDNTLINGDVVTVKLTSNATCRTLDTVSSTGITMTVNSVLVPAVTVAALPAGPVCTGTNVTFTATPANGGSTPVYQWRKNGISVGTNSATYSDNALANGDVITVRLTSDALCRSVDTVNSAGLTMTINPYPVATATPATQTICSGAGTSIALTATVPGTTFSWTVAQSGVGGAANGNGTAIAQTLSTTATASGTATYTITPLAAGCAGTPVTATITVNPRPSATATPASQTICSGVATNIALTANITGTTYTWTIAQSGVTGASAGSGSSIAQTLTNSGTAAGTATYTITPTVNSCPGTPLPVIITVNPKPVATITPSSQTLCSGSATGLALTSGVAGTTFSWTVSQSGVTGAAAGSGSSIAQTLTTTAPVTGTATYTITPAASGCNGNTATATVTVNAIPAAPGVISGPDAPCAGSTQTYTVGSITGASSYQWTLPAGWTGTSTTNSITVTVGNTNGTITVRAANVCGASAISGKPVVATPVLTPTVSISHDAPELLCSGTQVTYTAAITNGGTFPAYQWKLNGTNVGSNSNNYVYEPEDGDTITCTLTSNYPCLTGNGVVSNPLIMDVTPTVNPSLNIYVVENHICSDTPVTLLATPVHAGTAPAYQWKLNNSNVGTNSVNYTFMPADGDVVTCIMSSNAVCANPVTVTSNPVPMTIIQVTHPSVSITANPGSNVSNGQTVTFTANTSGAGSSGYQVRWYRNNVFLSGATGNTWTAVAGTDFFNNSKIKAELYSFSPCAIPDSAWSNEINMAVGATGITNTKAPDGFKAYPNPTQNSISFEGLHKGDRLQVRDVTGRLLISEEVDRTGVYRVDISRFAQGVYLFYFNNTEDKRWQVKVFRD